ncbi:MAG: hypothetical protein Q7S17_06060, partial [Xanthobacteraceae bacterium]|nr:hypothetical protein [Xanthobacteraceae bacterium]
MRLIVIAAFVVALFALGPARAVPAGLVEVSNSFILTQGVEKEKKKDTKKKKSTEQPAPSTGGSK